MSWQVDRALGRRRLMVQTRDPSPSGRAVAFSAGVCVPGARSPGFRAHREARGWGKHERPVFESEATDVDCQ